MVFCQSYDEKRVIWYTVGMRRIFALALAFTLIASGSYFYYTLASTCVVPFTYRLGTFDPRFNITEAQAKAILVDAETVWESAAGRELFRYDDASDFPINFIFDDRQERTIAEEAQRESLDKKEETSSEVGAQYAVLLDEYTKMELAYKKSVTIYETKLDAFNQTVAEYNEKGGAPEAVFTDLKRTETALATEATSLQQTSRKLATLAKNINDVSERGNRLIAQYNAGVSEYNHEFGSPNEFTQGDYQGTNINIYKFSTISELVNVLAHEFGHALGVGHVEGEASIMYYLMEAQPNSSTLSDTDKVAFNAVCADGVAPFSKLRQIIYSLITIVV